MWKPNNYPATGNQIGLADSREKLSFSKKKNPLEKGKSHFYLPKLWDESVFPS
jgi:hypothetical protein